MIPSRNRTGTQRLPSCILRLTKSMETMGSMVEFCRSVSMMTAAGNSRLKLLGCKLITGGPVAMICSMNGWDRT